MPHRAPDQAPQQKRAPEPKAPPQAAIPADRSLYERQIFKMSVTNALGCGQQKGYHESYRGTDVEVNLLKKVRIDIAVNDEFVDSCIEAIVKGAWTGSIGDGKIFVTSLEQCIRIRTSETGPAAIG